MRLFLTQPGTAWLAFVALTSAACSGGSSSVEEVGGAGGVGGALVSGGRDAGGVSGMSAGGAGAALDEARTVFSKVVYEKGQYLVFGTREHTVMRSQGFILSSTDASHWNLVHQGEGEYFHSITRSETAWYALGDIYDPASTTFERLFLRSDDGELWTAVTPPNAWSFYDVFWTGELLLATASDRDRQLFLESEDGEVWTERSDARLDHLTWMRGSRFVVGERENELWQSVDGGRTFTYRLRPASTEPLGGIVGMWSAASGFEGTMRYDCCFGELPGNILYYKLSSSDGAEWSIEPTTRSAPFEAVERDGVSVGIDRDFVLVHRESPSEDWSYANVGRADSVTAGERFVAVGVELGIQVSDDGVNWSPAESVEEPD